MCFDCDYCLLLVIVLLICLIAWVVLRVIGCCFSDCDLCLLGVVLLLLSWFVSILSCWVVALVGGLV